MEQEKERTGCRISTLAKHDQWRPTQMPTQKASPKPNPCHLTTPSTPAQERKEICQSTTNAYRSFSTPATAQLLCALISPSYNSLFTRWRAQCVNGGEHRASQKRGEGTCSPRSMESSWMKRISGHRRSLTLSATCFRTYLRSLNPIRRQAKTPCRDLIIQSAHHYDAEHHVGEWSSSRASMQDLYKAIQCDVVIPYDKSLGRHVGTITPSRK